VASEILRCAQDDRSIPILPGTIHQAEVAVDKEKGKWKGAFHFPGVPSQETLEDEHVPTVSLIAGEAWSPGGTIPPLMVDCMVAAHNKHVETIGRPRNY
jgi:hypothetical protein